MNMPKIAMVPIGGIAIEHYTRPYFQDGGDHAHVCKLIEYVNYHTDCVFSLFTDSNFVYVRENVVVVKYSRNMIQKYNM